MFANASGRPSAAPDCRQSVPEMAKILSISVLSTPFVDNTDYWHHPQARRRPVMAMPAGLPAETCPAGHGRPGTEPGRRRPERVASPDGDRPPPPARSPDSPQVIGRDIDTIDDPPMLATQLIDLAREAGVNEEHAATEGEHGQIDPNRGGQGEQPETQGIESQAQGIEGAFGLEQAAQSFRIEGDQQTGKVTQIGKANARGPAPGSWSAI
jgi:hypothetical protein